MSISREATSKCWKYFYIHFPLDRDYLHLLQWPEIGKGIFQLSVPEGPGRKKIISLFEDALESAVSSEPLVKDLLRNSLEEILIRCRQLALRGNTKPMDKRIASAASYIRQYSEKPIAISDIAQEVGLSSSRLSILFKQQTGASPLQWRDQQRMLKACYMLVDSQRTLSQIAESVGYNDSHYFSRCFRQHMDCTPSQYRKENNYFARY